MPDKNLKIGDIDRFFLRSLYEEDPKQKTS